MHLLSEISKAVSGRTEKKHSLLYLYHRASQLHTVSNPRYLGVYGLAETFNYLLVIFFMRMYVWIRT